MEKRAPILDLTGPTYRQEAANGVIESLNGRMNELLKQPRFDSQADQTTILLNDLRLCQHHHISQRAIGSKTRVQALEEW
jgi:hypothetical protein